MVGEQIETLCSATLRERTTSGGAGDDGRSARAILALFPAAAAALLLLISLHMPPLRLSLSLPMQLPVPVLRPLLLLGRW